MYCKTFGSLLLTSLAFTAAVPLAGQYILPNRLAFRLLTDLHIAYSRSPELAVRDAGNHLMYVIYASHNPYHSVPYTKVLKDRARCYNQARSRRRRSVRHFRFLILIYLPPASSPVGEDVLAPAKRGEDVL